MCLAIPGQVLSIEQGADASQSGPVLMRQGRIAFAGIIKRVNLAYVPDARVGDYVLVHAGFAIAIVNEDEARSTLAYLAAIESEELS